VEEEAWERRTAGLQRKRKRGHTEDKDRVEDMVGPKEIGEVEKETRQTRQGQGFQRVWGEDTFMEADEETLMCGGDNFRKRWEFSVTSASVLRSPSGPCFLLVTEHSLSLP
jgi:hypothetical protein